MFTLTLRQKIVSLLSILAVALTFCAPMVAMAQGTLTQDQDPLGVSYGQYSGLSRSDIRVTTARVINSILGLLGTVAVSLIVYAGFLWMTSAGNEDKASQAQKIIWAAAIGLLIIMSAYAITSYIVQQGYAATKGADYRMF